MSSENAAEMAPKGYRKGTEIVTLEHNSADPYNPASTPIYQTATFKQTSAVSCGEYDYSRSGNPTRTQLGMCTVHGLRVCDGAWSAGAICLPVL